MEKCCECGGVFNRVESAIQNHEPCATKHGAQPTDVQQLKAEIAARLSKVDDFPKYNIPGPVQKFIEAMRQLSAV